ncbi:kinesin [Plasmodium cynomolgi strain B]|uniref:Kinesin n=1 Tax=Plasmodium cynomolgi (strain B) TaxID=1120755 RepID=K6UPF9_PLACD|nr:kinesin [Plasmodium cynomolgi strain B]GAB64474.1 kinesin [Plasmodium cynomolgi strain B]
MRKNRAARGEREKGLLPSESNHPEEARTHKLESVVVRIKKLEKNEKPTLHVDPNDKTVLYFDKGFEIEQYHFDLVFDGDDDNKKIFLEIGGHRIVHNACRGFKETIITYGQTGSGKTYTLFGSNEELGIIHYFLHHLYRVKRSEVTKKTIYLSIYEVIGDKLVDLMTNVNERNAQFYTQDYYLKTIRHSYKVVNVASFEMAKKLIDTACLMRNVETTSQNRRSSRSHAIIHLFVNISDFTHHDGMETTRDYYGVLTFVDLVGCEREEFNTEANQSRNEKTSTKFLNSSLTSLNKMLRKMQMGNLDESDKRQSVLCKVLFNYIKKTCGVCLIFCFNPRQCQKSLTSSTLIMASDCKKIKSKRKQLIYVKTENRDQFFKRMTHGKCGNNEGRSGRRNGGSPLSGESPSRTTKKDSSRGASTGKGGEMAGEAVREAVREAVGEAEGAPSKPTAIGTAICTAIGADATVVLVHSGDATGHHNGTHVLPFRKGNDKQEALKKILYELIDQNKEEEMEREKTIQQLHSSVDKLAKECSYWKRQAHNYYKKSIMLHRNYTKTRELLFNTLHSGENDFSVGTIGSSTSCHSFVHPDEGNSLPHGGNTHTKENQHVKKESLNWEKKQLYEKYDPVRSGEIQTGDITSYQKKYCDMSSRQASNQGGLSKGVYSFIGSKQGRKGEHNGGYSHHMETGGHFEAGAFEEETREAETREAGTFEAGTFEAETFEAETFEAETFEADMPKRRDNEEGRTLRQGSYSGAGTSSTYTRSGCNKVENFEPKIVGRNGEQVIIKSKSSAKVPTGGTQLETKRDVRNANQITIDSLTTKIRNRILKSRSLSTAGKTGAGHDYHLRSTLHFSILTLW